MFKINTKPLWAKNLIILWFGVFMTGIGMSEVMPFLSLFINELGNFTKTALTIYSSLVFAISFLVMAIVSPFWGRLADKKGRKLMLLRASLGMAIVFLLMGFVTNVWQLMFLRALQGAFGGYVSNSNALVAMQTPKEHSGHALSILVTGITAGTLLGPLIGGILASLFTYRISFYITGIIMFLVFILTYKFVHEDFVAPNPNKKETLPKQSFRAVTTNPLIIILFITTMIIQIVNMSINPILSLFVKELGSQNISITLVAGIVAAMPGISTVIAAPLFGKLGDRIGTHKLLTFGFTFGVFIFFATFFVQNIYQLTIFRFLTGLANATLLPSVQTLLTKNTPSSNTSLVFSYNQSFQAIGSVFGPLLGALIANFFDYRGIFLFSSIIMLVNLGLFSYYRLNHRLI